MSDTGNISGSGYVGMLSPDGQWRWNGVEWVPARPPVQPSRSTFWPVLGALVAFAVIVMIGVGFYDAQQKDQQLKDIADRTSCEYDPSSC